MAGPDQPGVPQPGPSLKVLPRDELLNHAADLGLALPADIEAESLIEQIEHRRRLIDSLPRETLLAIAVWARCPVKQSAGKDELVRQISRLGHMRFAGLSDAGLRALAQLRGCDVEPDDDRGALKRKLKAREGLWRKFHRKKRALFGKLIARVVGDAPKEYRFLPEEKRPLSLKERIEDEGVVSGLTGRLRGAADVYVREKLDEIEARIDRKLDEIDRRLAEWRDREIANRLRIIRITLLASIIVALLSLGYSYLKARFGWWGQ